MPDASKPEKRNEKNSKTQSNALHKVAAFLVKIGKRLKSFFISMKAELKRVVWPDRKKLIQNTATVLAICLLMGTLLFVIDFTLTKVLEGIGFYSTASTTAATTAATTTGTTTTGTTTTGATTDTSGSSATTASGTAQTTSGTTSATTANTGTTTTAAG
jgi:preprotein translocase SecE subunit